MNHVSAGVITRSTLKSIPPIVIKFDDVHNYIPTINKISKIIKIVKIELRDTR